MKKISLCPYYTRGAVINRHFRFISLFGKSSRFLEQVWPYIFGLRRFGFIHLRLDEGV